MILLEDTLESGHQVMVFSGDKHVTVRVGHWRPTQWAYGESKEAQVPIRKLFGRPLKERIRAAIVRLDREWAHEQDVERAGSERDLHLRRAAEQALYHGRMTEDFRGVMRREPPLAARVPDDPPSE